MSRLDAALDELRAFDTLALRDTAIARLDARAKVIVTLAYALTVVSFGRYDVAALLPLALFPWLLTVLGEVPVRALLRKLLVAAPFPLMVGIFNPWLDRAPQLLVGELGIAGGWLSYASIVLRFALTVSAALVLLATTGMHPLCLALQRLGLPRAFVTQLLFLHRYALLLGGEAARMGLAHRLRAGGLRPRLATWASLVGHLLLRTLERAQRIHLAMLARGWDGQLRSWSALQWQRRDTVFTVGWLAYFALARALDLSAVLGRLAAGLPL